MSDSKDLITRAGSGDDEAIGGSGREFYRDVWNSRDGRVWNRVTDDAPWTLIVLTHSDDLAGRLDRAVDLPQPSPELATC